MDLLQMKRSEILNGQTENSVKSIMHKMIILPKIQIKSTNLENLSVFSQGYPKIYTTMDINSNAYNVKINVRGSSSSYFPKKQFKIETQEYINNEYEDKSYELLGMSKEEDWILHAPYSDKTCLRNVLAYTLGRLTMEYSPDFRFVELEMDGVNNGLYILMEKIKRDKNRVNINKNKTSDNNGAFIFKFDRMDDGSYPHDYQESDEIFNVSINNSNLQVLYSYPSYDDIDHPNFDSQPLKTLFENAASNPRMYVDIPSFCNFVIINELGKNIDAYWLSTYMYKHENENKLYFGPIWDFNLAFGNVNYGNLEIEGLSLDQGWNKQKEFFKIIYNELKQDVITLFKNSPYYNIEFIKNILKQNADLIYFSRNCNALSENFDRWNTLGVYVWPNPDGYENRLTYESEYDYLIQWLENRIIWLQSHWNI